MGGYGRSEKDEGAKHAEGETLHGNHIAKPVAPFNDGFVKSPSAALCFISCHCDVR
jgi:hypothetical protein